MSTGPATTSGPLAGLTVLEVDGIGSLPLFGMLFSDLGARVVRIDRTAPGPRVDPKIWMFRGRESLTLDTQQDRRRDGLLRQVESADVLVEGFVLAALDERYRSGTGQLVETGCPMASGVDVAVVLDA